MLDEVFQGLIDRTRRWLDVPVLKTIFGRKRRRNHRRRDGTRLRLERVVDESDWDTTVFKVHWGKITLKIYDKGDRVLRAEVIVHNVGELRCGKALNKLPGVVDELRRMTIGFLNVVQAADVRFLGERDLDRLPERSRRGTRRLAGIDLNRPRMCAVGAAAMVLASKPDGFTSRELSERVRATLGKRAAYGRRQAAYDLLKLRAKGLAGRIDNTRRYRLTRRGIHILVGTTILCQNVIKPVLAGLGNRRSRCPRHYRDPLDLHYENLQVEMRQTLKTLQVLPAAAGF